MIYRSLATPGQVIITFFWRHGRGIVDGFLAHKMALNKRVWLINNTWWSADSQLVPRDHTNHWLGTTQQCLYSMGMGTLTSWTSNRHRLSNVHVERVCVHAQCSCIWPLYENSSAPKKLVWNARPGALFHRGFWYAQHWNAHLIQDYMVHIDHEHILLRMLHHPWS